MGWVYNLKNPNVPSDAPRLIGIGIAFSAIGCFAVALRFYVRGLIIRKIWWDDWTALIAVLLALAYGTITIYQTRWGQGLSADFFPPENYLMFGKVQYSGGPVYTLTLLFFKVSFLTSYLRIAGFQQKWRRIVTVVMALCVVNNLIMTFLICFVCWPVQKIWDVTFPPNEGHCINAVAFYYSIAGTNLGFDILIILLPIPLVLSLQLKTRQKVALIGIFAIGFFVTIIQIIRVFSIANLKSYTNSHGLISWSIVEINIAILTCCIPTYGPLFRYFSAVVTSRGTPGSYGYNKSGPSNNHSLNRPQISKPKSLHTSKHSLTDNTWHSYQLQDLNGRSDVQTSVMGGRRRGAGGALSPDNSSEEHIIRATTEVRVESVRSNSDIGDAESVERKV